MKCAICNRKIKENEEKIYPGVDGKVYCERCVHEKQLIHCSHEGCPRYMLASEAHLTGKGFLCNDHFNHHYGTCAECGEVLQHKFLHRINSRTEICQTCFEKKYFQCEECGEVHQNSEKVVINVEGREITICRDCRKNYKNCPHCGKLMHHRKIITFLMRNDGPTQITRCESCVGEEFFRCSECGNWHKKDDIKFIWVGEERQELPEWRKYICEICKYRRGVIHNYSFKPPIHKYVKEAETSEVLFGMENEIELNFNKSSEKKVVRLSNDDNIELDYRRWMSFEIEKLMPEFFYQKSDGSLRYGIEMVSHPATLEYWYSREGDIRNLFSFLIRERCEGRNASKAGMHVHITRTKMNRAHMNSFSGLIHGNRNWIQKLALRNGNHYSQYIDIPKNDASAAEKILGEHQDRYKSVNWNNRNTVEVRIFQSVLEMDRFFGNLEFCKAAYYFTQTRSTAECLADDVFEKFKEYVVENGYKYLPSILNGIRI